MRIADVCDSGRVDAEKTKSISGNRMDIGDVVYCIFCRIYDRTTDYVMK